jgi:hypothetical protein
MLSYKSHELNIFSNDEANRFKIQDSKGIMTGFGSSQESIYLRYTDISTQNQHHPVVIDALHYMGDGYPVGVHWKFYDTNNKIDEEKKRAQDFENILSESIDNNYNEITESLNDETTARTSADDSIISNLATETSERQSAVFSLNASIVAEAKTARASELLLTNNLAQANLDLSAEVKRAGDEEKKISSSLSSEVADRKTAVSAEQKRAEDEEKKINSSISDVNVLLNSEITDRSNAVSNLQTQINTIMAGSSDSLNSFIELVNDYNNQLASVGNTNYIARIAYLEAVVQELVNKSN